MNSTNNILDYLDRELENFYKRTGNYPTKIIMNKKTEKKISIELKKCVGDLSNCWVDKNLKNYRGILITISEAEEIKLE